MNSRLLFLIAACGWVASMCGCSDRAALSDREVATRVLAEHLAREIRPKHVAVLSNPFTQLPGRSPEIYTFEKAGIDGLKKGLAEATRISIVFPKLSPRAIEEPQALVPAGSKTPLSFLLEKGSVDEALASAAGADLVVSLIGLPAGLSEVKAWSDRRTKLALLLPDWALLGPPECIRSAFHEGKLAAAVVNRPGARETSKEHENYRKLFDEKFVLVTAGNIDELLNKSPEIFH